MIIVFGASTDIGQRLIAKLQQYGLAHRGVSRTIRATVADLQTGEGVAEAIAGANVVVSCAHARYTRAILDAAPSDAQLVLVGSAWRYSSIANESADLVREAEKLFLASSHCGVMMHPTMIYGGAQENNVRRLLKVIKKTPIIPAPGGGRQLIAPIYIDDLVDCLFAAATIPFDRRHVFGVAGPSLTWRKMVIIISRSIGLRRHVVSIPNRPAIIALDALKRFGIGFVDSDILRRFSEDVEITTDQMRDILSVTPRRFEDGVISALASWDFRLGVAE